MARTRIRRIRLRPAQLLVIAFVTLALFGLLFQFDDKIFGSKGFIFWVQVITGNWSQEGKDDVGKIQFALSIGIALFLNVATIGTIGTLLWNILVVVERIQPMELTSAFMLRDRSVKEEIYNAIGDGADENFINSVEEAFKRGTALWAEKQLPAIVGPEEAERVLNRLKEQGQTPL